MRIYVSVRFNVSESLGGHGRIQGDFKSPVYTTRGIMRNTANISSHSNQKSHHDNPHRIICLNLSTRTAFYVIIWKGQDECIEPLLNLYSSPLSRFDWYPAEIGKMIHGIYKY